MKAVILAGGLGTRISEETDLKPKPMIEIGGKPILWHIMKMYSANDVHEFIICCGYKGYVIKEYFANYFLHQSDVTFDMSKNTMEVHHERAEPWKVTLIDTGENSMTGGRLKQVSKYIENDDEFFFTYGDGVSDVNIKDTLKFHRSHNKLATLTATYPPGRFGALDICKGQINQFKEKPKGDGSLINGGFFVLSPKVLNFIEDDSTIWEQYPLNKLAEDGELMAYEHHGFWQPMDTLRDKHLLEKLWKDKKSPVENMVVNKEFWKNKKVLVTGHTGFKGSWLSLWLQEMGANVVGVSLEPPTNPSIYEQARVGENMQSLRADIRDLDNIKKIFREYKPDIVFHLAAQPLVRYSYREPIETYQTNVMGTLNILEAIRSIDSVRAAVMITTDKCYENREWEWGYRENEPMGGHDPYSSSKGCAELLIASYRDSYFPVAEYNKHKTAIASVRAGNVIGGGDWAEDRLIPDIIRSVLLKDLVHIRNPNSIRPWQHVLEPLDGYLVLAEKLFVSGDQYSEAWNFGPKDENAKPVQWIVERMIKLWGEDASWVVDDGDHPHEANYLKLDCSKAHTKLNWRPKWSLKNALEKIIEWHKEEQKGADMRLFSLSQIECYMKVKQEK